MMYEELFDFEDEADALCPDFDPEDLPEDVDELFIHGDAEDDWDLPQEDAPSDGEEEDCEGKNMPLGHRGRSRWRITADNIEEITQRDLLDLMLYHVLPRGDVRRVSDMLLKHYGSLANLLESDPQELHLFESLGEFGAQWLERLIDLIRTFGQLEHVRGPKIANFRQLYAFAQGLRSKFDNPCCVQLLTDDEDRMIFFRRVAEDLNWGETAAIVRAAKDATRSRAANVYLILLTDDLRAHPRDYDRKALDDYALLMRNAGCAIRDVLFLCGESCVSMHRLNQIPETGPDGRARDAREDKCAPLPGDRLIVRSCADKKR